MIVELWQAGYDLIYCDAPVPTRLALNAACPSVHPDHSPFTVSTAPLVCQIGSDKHLHVHELLADMCGSWGWSAGAAVYRGLPSLRLRQWPCAIQLTYFRPVAGAPPTRPPPLLSKRGACCGPYSAPLHGSFACCPIRRLHPPLPFSGTAEIK